MMAPAWDQLAQDLATALTAAGLPFDVPLMVHTGLRGLLQELSARGCAGDDLRERACACYADALDLAAGPQGTVCVPGYYYNYARHGQLFDLRTSPPDDALGAFPQYFFQHRMEKRGLSPLVSLMTRGAHADFIAAAPSTWGNGVKSSWARLTDADGYALFFGCTPAAMTFTHHIEQLVGVPHLYNKIYRIPIIDLDGVRHEQSICSVRFLDPRFPVTYDLSQFTEDMTQAGVLKHASWGSAAFSYCSLRESGAFLTEKLFNNPSYILAAPPAFIRGVLPDDGKDWDGVVPTA